MATMNSKWAVVNDRLLWAMGSYSLENMIDTTAENQPAGKPLQAHEAHPPNGFCYYDVNMGGYLSYIAAFMPPEAGNAKFAQAADAVKKAPPVTGAGYRAKNRMQWQLFVPAELAETGMNFMMKNQ